MEIINTTKDLTELKEFLQQQIDDINKKIKNLKEQRQKYQQITRELGISWCFICGETDHWSNHCPE